jgi:hypothetical protein
MSFLPFGFLFLVAVSVKASLRTRKLENANAATSNDCTEGSHLDWFGFVGYF